MSRTHVVIVAAALLFIAARDAHAQTQKTQRIGVLIAAPTLIGFHWELSNRVALRPDFSLSTSSFSGSGGQTTSHTKRVAVGLSGVIYMQRWDALRSYVSTRFAHGISRSGSTTTQTDVSGSIGAEYDLAPRFGLFAEAGVGYSLSRTTAPSAPDPTANTSSNRTVGTRASIGAILFF